MPDLVKRQDSGHVARLTLNDPANVNALSLEMIETLIAAFRDIQADGRIRAVIVAAEGKAFSAGHDLRQMQQARADDDAGRAAYERLFARCAALMQMIPALPQPVIAQVQGVATAAGCQLVASCDLAIAAQGARFGVNGVNIGLFCSTPMVALSRNIPRKKAFEMLTTGQFIAADEAERLGLINRSVPAGDLAETAQTLAETVASKLGAAVKIGKQAFYEQIQMPLDRAYAFTGDVMVENMMHRDTEEGIAAFIDKRPPDWKQ